MSFTADEKKVIKIALEKHLEEVQGKEEEVGQDVRELAVEMKYDDFVRSIIKKLG